MIRFSVYAVRTAGQAGADPQGVLRLGQALHPDGVPARLLPAVPDRYVEPRPVPVGGEKRLLTLPADPLLKRLRQFFLRRLLIGPRPAARFLPVQAAAAG